MKTLGDELRTKEEEKRKMYELQRAEQYKRETEENNEEGRKLANSIINILPEKLEYAQKTGRGYVDALTASYRLVTRGKDFSPIERHAAYLIKEWARSNGLFTYDIPYRIDEGGETTQALWISWQPFIR